LNENDAKKAGIYKIILKNKKYQYVLIAVLLSIMLIIYFASLADDTKADNTATEIIDEYNDKQNITSEIENILSSIKGAGEVKVMINYSSSPEIVTATSTQSDSVTTFSGENESSRTENIRSDIVTVKNDEGENALVLKELTPEISGVIVTAQGAGKIDVKLKLIDAVTTLLDISQSKVDVFEMQNKYPEEIR